MVAKSCTTWDGRKPNKTMGCLPPINGCRISQLSTVLRKSDSHLPLHWIIVNKHHYVVINIHKLMLFDKNVHRISLDFWCHTKVPIHGLEVHWCPLHHRGCVGKVQQKLLVKIWDTLGIWFIYIYRIIEDFWLKFEDRNNFQMSDWRYWRHWRYWRYIDNTPLHCFNKLGLPKYRLER